MQNVVKKYTVQELSSILNLSDTAIRKQIKKGRFQTCSEQVGSRSVTKVILSDNELNQLIQDYSKNKVPNQVLNQFDEPEKKFSEVHQTSSFDDENGNKAQIDSNKMIEFVEVYTNKLENLYKQLNEKDKQIYLLEDIENRQKKEYFEIKAKLKELEEENKALKTKLDKKHWWKFW